MQEGASSKSLIIKLFIICICNFFSVKFYLLLDIVCLLMVMINEMSMHVLNESFCINSFLFYIKTKEKYVHVSPFHFLYQTVVLEKIGGRMKKTKYS